MTTKHKPASPKLTIEVTPPMLTMLVRLVMNTTSLTAEEHRLVADFQEEAVGILQAMADQ